MKMKKVKVIKEDGFLIVKDKETNKELLVTESWFWFMFVCLCNNWKLKWIIGVKNKLWNRGWVLYIPTS